MSDLPEDAVVVNCATCKTVLLAYEQSFPEPIGSGLGGRRKKLELPPVVAGRIQGRPYCSGCLRTGDGTERTDRRSEGQRDGLKRTRS